VSKLAADGIATAAGGPVAPDFLTTREAAERLGVALRTAQLWVEAGALPAWKTVGGHRRIPRGAVEAMQARRDMATAAAIDRVRVLLVESDDFLREIFRRMAEAAQTRIELATARDGFEALPRLVSWRPHLLVTDVLLPGMDGFRMLRSLREDPQFAKLEIAVATSMGAAEIAGLGGLPDGVRILPKPVPGFAFEQIVRGIRV